MEIYSHPAISDIINMENNSVCFDCGTLKPKWASINNGIFLCLKCAGIHKNFGVRFSIIRSLQHDNWDDKQIQFLKLGGNLNYKNFLNEYNIPSNTNNNDLKYKSKCSEYYRKYLRSLVEKEINPNYIEEKIEKPSLQEGIEIINDLNNNNIMTNNITNDEVIQSGQYKEEKEETFFGFVGNFFKKATKTVVDTGVGVGKKIEDLKIKEKVVQTGSNAIDIVKKGGTIFVNTTSDIAKKGGNLIIGAAQEVKDKGGNLIQKIGVKAEAGFNIIKDTTKSIIEGKNEETKENKNSEKKENNDINNINKNDINNNVSKVNEENNNKNLQNFDDIKKEDKNEEINEEKKEENKENKNEDKNENENEDKKEDKNEEKKEDKIEEKNEEKKEDKNEEKNEEKKEDKIEDKNEENN